MDHFLGVVLQELPISNMGSAIMPNASVTISLDEFLTISAASMPFTDLGNGMYQFNLGDLAPGAAGQIFLDIDTECSDDVILDQSLCITAEMSPISDCAIIDGYTGPDINIIGECTPDSVKFLISNTSGNMLIPYEFIVIEDEILRSQENIILLAGESETIGKEANGSTFSLVTNQVAENLFSRQISAFVEACSGNGMDVRVGYANMFPLNDEEPHLDIECLEVRGSFDPNDKNGLPSGFTITRNIDIGILIDYTIRFENIGNDTAFTIKVEDEIANELDLSTLQVLGSSHEVTITSQDRNLIFTFPNANLTPPMQDCILAQGYVKFQIAHQEGLALRTAIRNQAEIFFDFNSPIITNETFHTLGLDFPTSTNKVEENSKELQISPNPAQNLIRLNIGEEIQGEVLAVDLYGQHHSLLKSSNLYDISHLVPGFYIIKTNQNKTSYVGKLIIQ
ncbi:MAG: putative repeat protein (TIGR01451 family) [Halioglobus sp.]